MAWMRLGQLNDLKGRRGDAINAYKQAIAERARIRRREKNLRQYLSSPYKRAYSDQIVQHFANLV